MVDGKFAPPQIGSLPTGKRPESFDVAAAKLSSGGNPSIPDYLDVGDSVTVDHGKEIYSFGEAEFVVGGCSVETRVRSGETTGDAYARASAAARVMFEAEFESRLREIKLRIVQVSAAAERFEEKRSGK